MVSFASSIMKSNVEPFALLRFPVKLTWRIDFASSAYCLLKSTAIIF